MPSEAAEDGDGQLIDALYDCLRKRPRRRLLFELLDHDPPHVLHAPDDVHAGDRCPASLYLELRHRHLPMLEELGFVRWERSSRTVRRGPRYDHVRDLLETLRAFEPDRDGMGR